MGIRLHTVPLLDGDDMRKKKTWNLEPEKRSPSSMIFLVVARALDSMLDWGTAKDFTGHQQQNIGILG